MTSPLRPKKKKKTKREPSISTAIHQLLLDPGSEDLKSERSSSITTMSTTDSTAPRSIRSRGEGEREGEPAQSRSSRNKPSSSIETKPTARSATTPTTIKRPISSKQIPPLPQPKPLVKQQPTQAPPPLISPSSTPGTPQTMVVKTTDGDFLSPSSAFSSSPQKQLSTSLRSRISAASMLSLRPSSAVLPEDDPWNANSDTDAEDADADDDDDDDDDDDSESDLSGLHAPPILPQRPLLSDTDSSSVECEHAKRGGGRRQQRRDSKNLSSESENGSEEAFKDESYDSLLEAYANQPESSQGSISIPTLSDNDDAESDGKSDDDRESEEESVEEISLIPSRPLFVYDDDPDYFPNERQIPNHYSSNEREEDANYDYYSGSDDPNYHPNEPKILNIYDTSSNNEEEEFADAEYYSGRDGEEEIWPEESSIAEDDHFYLPQLKSIPEVLNESTATFLTPKSRRTRPLPPLRTHSEGDQSLSLSDLKAHDPLAKKKNRKQQQKDKPKDKDYMSSVGDKCVRWASLLLLAILLFDAALFVAFLVKRGNDDSPDVAHDVAAAAMAVPLDPEKNLAKVYVTLCLEWVPGQGKSALCLPEATPLGGQVGNLVATAIRQQTGADIALISAGTTQDDIPAGIFTVGDAQNVLGRDARHPLVQLQVSGEQIEIILEQSVVSALDDFRPTHYPYAAGMRFDVNGGGSLKDPFLAGSMVSNVEVNIEDEWVPLDTRQMYTLVTTKLMADGGLGYLEFANVEEGSRQALDLDLGTALMDYAETVNVLEEPESSTKSFVNELANRRLVTVPKNICLEWVPGQGRSEICSGEEYAEQAGGACNLVSWAMVVQAGSEVAILNAGECRSDIWQGGFWVEDAKTLLPTNLQLVILNITGSAMVRALEGAVDNALGESKSQGSYPYAGRLRYTVDFSAELGSRLSNVEWFEEGKTWSELNPQRFYQLVTTLYLALGNNGYDEFEKVPYKETNMKLQNVLIEYAETLELLMDPSRDKYSTQQFLAT